MIVVRVTNEEAPRLLALARQTFIEAFANQNNPDDFDAYIAEVFNEKSFSKELQNQDSFFFFLMLNDTHVGYLKLNTNGAQTEWQEADGLEIQRIYILKAHQNLRFGQVLMNFSIDFARNLHKKYIWLGVWEANRSAIRFYERNGFETFSSHVFMMGNDPQTDFLMKRELTTF